MINSTSGIVLRVVKYGESNGVVTIYTELFGLQSYLINGIRSSAKKSRSHLYQPGSILEMEVYHNPLKNLQRVKDAGWKVIYRSIFTDIIKSSIALFIVELLHKSILAEEQNELLYHFAEGWLAGLDELSAAETADVPLKFMLSLPSYLGFKIENNYSEKTPFFDLKEGKFSANDQDPQIELSAILNRSLSGILENLKGNGKPGLNGQIRRSLLHLVERYYQYHVAGFKELKTLRVLEMIMKG